MKKFSFQHLLEKIQLAAIRFPFALFFVFGLAFELFVNANVDNVEIPQHNWAFFTLGIFVSIAVTLFMENFRNYLIRIVGNLLAVIVLLVYCFTLPEKFMQADIYQLVVLGIVFVLMAFVVSYFKKSTDVPFWEFSKTSIIQLIMTMIFAVVLMLGLSLAVLSLKELFKIDIDNKVYRNLSIFCFALFAPVYFLANIPDETEKQKQEFNFNKFLKILGLYILVPILTLYTLILYVYLIQIISKWQLPEGWVSWLVSILALGGFLCMMILYPMQHDNENKIVSFLSRYFPLILLPLLILMTVGISRRFDDYGLTINRAYVFLLNFWLYGICIYLFLTKSNHLKWIVISFSAVAFISSVGPWSVYNVTRRSMVKEIGQLLSEAHLMKNGKAIDNSKLIIQVNDSLSNQMGSKIDYVCDNFGNQELQQYFKTSIEKKTVWEIKKSLGNSSCPSFDEHRRGFRHFEASINNKSYSADVENFKTFVNINKDNENKESILDSKEMKISYRDNSLVVQNKVNSVRTTISLNNKLKEISTKNKMIYPAEELTISNSTCKLIITRLMGYRNSKNDSITVTDIQASLFLK